jgi:hypothetical protein
MFEDHMKSLRWIKASLQQHASRARLELNPVVQVLNPKKYGRAPWRVDDLLDIPARYLVAATEFFVRMAFSIRSARVS